MYAIIRTGGKQAKVREGDVIDVERLRGDDEVTFTPLLVVDDKGTVFSDREALKTAKVVAKVVGDSTGPKIDIFKYKNKTGYRRRQGHRQRYTTIEVTKITKPGAKKKTAAKADDAAEAAEEKAPAAKKPAAPAAKAAGSKKPAAKTTAAKTTAAKKPAAKKPAAKKPAAKKPSAAKAADTADDSKES